MLRHLTWTETGKPCRWRWGKVGTWSLCTQRKKSADEVLLQSNTCTDDYDNQNNNTNNKNNNNDNHLNTDTLPSIDPCIPPPPQNRRWLPKEHPWVSPVTNPLKPSTCSGKISQSKNQLAKPSVTTLYVVLHSPWPRSVTNPLQVQADSRKGAQRIRSKKELRIKTILVGF